MTRYLVLGVIQGATEFLPISSSGHLVLAQRWLGIDPPGVLLEALLHWGTLLAVLVVFRGDLLRLLRGLSPKGTVEDRKDIGLLIAGSVPIVVLGLGLRSTIGGLFASTTMLAAGFLTTGILLLLPRVFHRRVERNRARFADALIVGLAQASAILPGLSRSGATISLGRLSGMTPRGAARFSFLLAIPALLGAGLISLWDAAAAGTPGVEGWEMVSAMLAAFIVGWGAIRFLLALLSRGTLWVFAPYCLVLGGLTMSGLFG